MACTSGWVDPREMAENLTWARAFYKDLFAETGGVPAPGERYEWDPRNVFRHPLSIQAG
jgi:aclacinomycin oxidase